MYERANRPNELYHHGVKGMKWGQHLFAKHLDRVPRFMNRGGSRSIGNSARGISRHAIGGAARTLTGRMPNLPRRGPSKKEVAQRLAGSLQRSAAFAAKHNSAVQMRRHMQTTSWKNQVMSVTYNKAVKSAAAVRGKQAYKYLGMNTYKIYQGYNWKSNRRATEIRAGGQALGDYNNFINKALATRYKGY